MLAALWGPVGVASGLCQAIRGAGRARAITWALRSQSCPFMDVRAALTARLLRVVVERGRTRGAVGPGPGAGGPAPGERTEGGGAPQRGGGRHSEAG